MKTLLAADLPDFARCLTMKLLTYALGRGLERYDNRTIEEIVKKAEGSGYRFQALISEIVRSLPFQSRRGEEAPVRSDFAKRTQKGGQEAVIVTRKSLNRRTFLRGAGAAVALPLLDSMIPAFAGPKVSKTPVRIGWVYVPNGIDMRFWSIKEEGPLTSLPRILKPLEPFKKDILVISNLAQNYGRALFDGPGDHGRAAANYLTGVHVYKTAGADIKLGISADQVAANELGHLTQLPSLELGLEDGRRAGDCDSGYSLRVHQQSRVAQ
jgi:hypothetical protein